MSHPGSSLAPAPTSAGALTDQGGKNSLSRGSEVKTYLANIHGAYVFYSPRYEDNRGDYCNISTHMVVLESGTATSKKNVLRGMHCSPFPKIIACLSGIMYDVLIDLRKGSPTFKKWE